MPDNETVKDRIKEFIKSKKIGQGKFELLCGLSNGYVNNIRVSIQPDKLEKIALQYPELSKSWVMTGEGEMLNSDNITVKEVIKYRSDPKDLEEIRLLHERINALEAQLKNRVDK